MVLLVYSVISPLTNFFISFCFRKFLGLTLGTTLYTQELRLSHRTHKIFAVFLGTMLRHQFLFVYPKVPDSGGKIWSNFIKIYMGCMIMAQLTSKSFFILFAMFDDVSLLRHSKRTSLNLIFD